MENTLNNQKYEYLISNGHHLVNIENKILVLDTGSPISFSINGDFNSINIKGIKYGLNNNLVRLNSSVLNDFIGVNIDGFLGMDILSKTGGVQLDKINKRIVFASGMVPLGCIKIPLNLVDVFGMNYLEMKFIAGGVNISALFDTGACISYINPEIARLGIFDGNTRDYSPTFGGWIETTKIKLPVMIASQSQDLSMAIMTTAIKSQLSILGYKAVLGINEIQWDVMSIDIKNNELVYC
jgi:hypothetical protein